MADNFTITAGTGVTIAGDDVGGVIYQRVKVTHGVDGVATDTTEASPLPVSSNLSTDKLTLNGVGVTPKFAKIDFASSGDNTIVAAVGGKKIRVLQYLFIVVVAQTITWKSGASTALSGVMSVDALSGVNSPHCPLGLIETAVGEALVLNAGGSNQTSGHLVYIEV